MLTPWPQRPQALELSNRETIAQLGEVEVQTLDEIARPEREELARAGDTLPWRRWLAPDAGDRAQASGWRPGRDAARAAPTIASVTDASSCSPIT